MANCEREQSDFGSNQELPVQKCSKGPLLYTTVINVHLTLISCTYLNERASLYYINKKSLPFKFGTDDLSPLFFFLRKETIKREIFSAGSSRQ